MIDRQRLISGSVVRDLSQDRLTETYLGISRRRFILRSEGRSAKAGSILAHLLNIHTYLRIILARSNDDGTAMAIMNNVRWAYRHMASYSGLQHTEHSFGVTVCMT